MPQAPVCGLCSLQGLGHPQLASKGGQGGCARSSTTGDHTTRTGDLADDQVASTCRTMGAYSLIKLQLAKDAQEGLVDLAVNSAVAAVCTILGGKCASVCCQSILQQLTSSEQAQRSFC